MPAYQLLPVCKDYIWGGQRLKTDFGIKSNLDPLSEAWVLSCHPDGPSALADGPFAGLTLPEYIKKEGSHVLGPNCQQFGDFPMLIKLIDAKQDLSVQVHPSDEYALAHEGQYGKTEMWVVLDAAPGAGRGGPQARTADGLWRPLGPVPVFHRRQARRSFYRDVWTGVLPCSADYRRGG